MHRLALIRSAGVCGFLGLLALPAVCFTAQGADPPIAPDARQSVQTRSPSLYAVRQGVFEAEDQRAPTAADVKVLVDGTRHASEIVQRMAVRALGRLERPAVVPDIVPLLAASSAAVRAEAANALGQVAPNVDLARQGEIPALLILRLEVERDPAVRGVLCQTIGRLPYSTAEGARRAEAALLAASDPPAGTTAPVPLAALHGVAKGFESLVRRNVKLLAPTPETVQCLRALAVDRRASQPAAKVETASRVRRLALAALASARLADQDTILAAAGDPDMQVRRLALMALAAAAPASAPDDVRGRVIRGGLADREYVVRYEALRIHGRSLASATAEWDPVLAALADPSAHVALLAIDLLGNAQGRPDAAVERLRREARTLPTALAAPAIGGSGNRMASTAEWHRAAHALVSLAKIAPDAARELLPAFVASPLWPARMYAARAAAIVRDADLLLRLADDPRDNVRDAALGGLRTLKGHDADDLYIAALQRPDYQLILTATRALEKTPEPAKAVPPLLAALARITAEGRDTSRDPRQSLIARIGELGQPGDAPALMPYTTDFDPQVATAAAALIGKWTGQPPAIAPRPLPIERVQLADIERLRSARVMVTMAGRGVFELELLTDDAPATVARFVRLAKAGYYNGLTFHRVVPNFLLQGGSPGANEFMGDGAYLRDELGLEPHVRGSVGISTRGRDTGDAQICPDLVDNPRLDHDYTVFARVVAGFDVLDRVLECDVIERIDIVAR
jgi:cyclophilin family peptidyl-prolyl cis-trans isomerase/HEAT repeat protein